VFSDEIAESGRKVFQQVASSVITVRANLLITTSDSEEESVGQCTAVLVSPPGVAILTLSALDPSILIDQEVRNSINISIASIKMIFKDEKKLLRKCFYRIRKGYNGNSQLRKRYQRMWRRFHWKKRISLFHRC
jgi:hypothetical protein